MNEKLQAVIGRMQHQIVALTAERDGAREQRDTARAELAAVTEEADRLRAQLSASADRCAELEGDIRDGLMEQVDDEGERADKAEVRIGEMEGEIAAVRGALREARDHIAEVSEHSHLTGFPCSLMDDIEDALSHARGTGEGCPTCKGTHMVSGTHGLDACPVCRPEPAKTCEGGA